jgi:uncharacterized protein
MMLDLRLLDRPTGQVSGEEVVGIDDPLAGRVAVPCRIEVEYRRAGAAFHLHGAVSGTLSRQCHRCLDPITERVEGEFDVVVRRGEHREETGDEVVVLSLHEHVVDLDPSIHETMVLNAPMIALCDRSCRGLCPTCGANLNRETCPCRPDPDPRWDALRER